MNNLWINKYRPNNISEFIGNSSKTKKLKNFILNFETQNYSSIIISGPHGIGKTLMVDLILKEVNYNSIKLTPLDIKNHKLIEDIFDLKNNRVSIKNKMLNYKKKNIIVIDESESITLNSEKNNIIELFKINNKKKYIPIIFICNTQHSKLNMEIKKSSIEIKMEYPSFNVLYTFCNNIIEKEKIILEPNDNNEILNKIIYFSQFDIRRLIILLQEIKQTFKNKKITIEDLQQYFKLSSIKILDIGLFESSSIIINSLKKNL